jgi:hypothetical protein
MSGRLQVQSPLGPGHRALLRAGQAGLGRRRPRGVRDPENMGCRLHRWWICLRDCSVTPIRTDPLRVLARIGRRAIAACCPARSNRSPLRKRRHYPRLRTVSIHNRSGQRPIQAVAMDTQHPKQ